MQSASGTDAVMSSSTYVSSLRNSLLTIENDSLIVGSTLRVAAAVVIAHDFAFCVCFPFALLFLIRCCVQYLHHTPREDGALTFRAVASFC